MTSYKIIFVYLWIACSAYPLDESQRCPEEFVQIDNSCYYFSADKQIAKKWADAQKFCTEHNSHLVSIESTKELLAIDNYSIYNNLKISWFWTAGSDLQNKNEFIWMDVQKLVTQKWCKDHPSAEKSYRCILLGLKQSGYEQCLINRNCENPYDFICESKLNSFTNKSVLSLGSKTINIYNQIFVT